MFVPRPVPPSSYEDFILAIFLLEDLLGIEVLISGCYDTENNSQRIEPNNVLVNSMSRCYQTINLGGAMYFVLVKSRSPYYKGGISEMAAFLVLAGTIKDRQLPIAHSFSH